MASADGSAARATPSVAVVLPGGGARGAYEIGALSVLLPALEQRGERVSVWCGTSVGAINAAALASRAHLAAAEQVARVQEIWSELRKQDVISRLVGPGGARVLLRLIGHAFGVPGVGLASVLDPSPLRGSLERWIDWGQVGKNIRAGHADALCVIATLIDTGQPIGFVSARTPLPGRVDEQIRYVRTEVRAEHIRASAAIPVLFPTVEITSPDDVAGHYTDGGTRLNSPIKPAIDLGAGRVIVVGLEPFTAGEQAPRHVRRAPSIADVAANVLDGLLVDQVATDLRRVATINSFFVEDVGHGTVASPRAYRIARGHQPYRLISYALVSPEHRGAIAGLAEEVFERRYGGLRGWRDLDFALMARAIGVGTRSRGEFLSFLLFDRAFIEELAQMGKRDAERWLERHPRFWCRDAAHDLSAERMDKQRLMEERALEEFRARRRH
jgi:NTE family protein